MDTYVSLCPQVLFTPAMSTFRDIKKHPSANWPFLVVPNNVIFKAAYRKHITRSDNTQSGVSGPQRDRGAVKKLASKTYRRLIYKKIKMMNFEHSGTTNHHLTHRSVQNDNFLCCQVPIIFIIFLITRKFCTIQTSNIEYLSRYQIMKNYLL